MGAWSSTHLSFSGLEDAASILTHCSWVLALLLLFACWCMPLTASADSDHMMRAVQVVLMMAQLAAAAAADQAQQRAEQ